MAKNKETEIGKLHSTVCGIFWRCLNMKELYPMHGIITTVITPFKSEDKSIDWPSFRREIQLCMDAGVAGFLAPSKRVFRNMRRLGNSRKITLPSPSRRVGRPIFWGLT